MHIEEVLCCRDKTCEEIWSYSCTHLNDSFCTEARIVIKLLQLLTTALTAPGNLRYTSVTANSIIFQWDSLTEDVQVSWYVITCSKENNIFTVSYSSHMIIINTS